MAQPLTKIMIIYLSINILLFVAGVRVIGGDNVNVIGDFVEVNNGSVIVSEGLVETLPTQLEGSFLSGIQQFIDSIGAVKKMIFFLVNISFTPLGLFSSGGMPVAITLMFGVPIMVVLILGVAYFIRSGS